MKISLSNTLGLLILGFSILFLNIAEAQTYTILHNFGADTAAHDGQDPLASLVVGPNGNLYGTTEYGGSNDGGTVFEMTPAGVVTILHNFPDNSIPNDGVTPEGALIVGTDGNFYGTTYGGQTGGGTVFRMTPSGAVTILHVFDDPHVVNDGDSPEAGLVQAGDGNFYGTTNGGGSEDYGTVFKMTKDGVVTILHSFRDGTVNNDGSEPQAPLVEGIDGNFYGTAEGTIFKITPAGAETILEGGIDPMAGLYQAADGNLYGTTIGSGLSSYSTFFKITPAGVPTILHYISDGSTLDDAYYTQGSVVQGSDGTFYGTSSDGGGPALDGAVFAYNAVGQYKILHHFGDGSVTNDGTAPTCGLTVGPNGLLYGVTSTGGSANSGTIFVIDTTKIILNSAVTASGVVAEPFLYEVKATGFPTHYAATGLPTGVSIDADSGVISGTPTTPGTSTVSLTVTTATTSATFSLSISVVALPVPVVTSSSTAFATAGVPFSYTATATNNPTTFIASGLASTGLSINSTTGVISGTPSSAANLTVKVTAVNATGQSTPGPLSIQVGATAPGPATAYVPGHSFRDGTVPFDGFGTNLVQGQDGNIYYLVNEGGIYGEEGDAIFKMTPEGAISLFYSFNEAEGLGPVSAFIQGSDGNFYFTTESNHAQFGRLDYNTGKITILASFLYTDRLNGVIQGSDGNFYGNLQFGGAYGYGAIVKITPAAVVSTLYSFSGDIINPINPLVQASDRNFYATAGSGQAFKLTPQGVFTDLHHTFTTPLGALIEASDGNLYGTAQSDENSEDGIVFKMTKAGVVTVLHNFGSIDNDGLIPATGLIEGFDGNFYGVTENGGTANLGTLFRMTPGGTVTVLHSFGTGTITNEGNEPFNPLIESNAGNIYGIAGYGGVPQGGGELFSYQAQQTPVHVPVVIGAMGASEPINHFFTFTPTATFGVAGAGAQALVVQPQPSGIMSMLASFLPDLIGTATASASWTMTGTLPPGLTFNSTTGNISGIPTTDGSTMITLQASNVAGTGAAVPVTLNFDSTPVIPTTGSASTLINNAFTNTIQPQQAALEFGATALPSFLSIDPAAGVVSGTPPIEGSFLYNLFAGNDAGQSSQAFTLSVTGGDPNSPTITSPATVNINAGALVTYQIATSTAADSFTALGLPPGFVFEPTTGLITGVATVPGTYPISLTANNAYGACASVLTLIVAQPMPPGIAATLSSTALTNVAYSYQIPATGSVTTYSAPGLPGTLTVNATTGLITGTPTAVGTYTVNISVTNGAGTSTSTLTLNVAAPVPFGTWTDNNNVMGGETGTPYSDGVPNLLKFFFHIDPTKPMTTAGRSGLPTIDTIIVANVPYVTLTFREYALATGVTYALQTSSDMKTWTTVSNPNMTPIGTDPNTGDSIYQVQAAMTGQAQFLRLQVTGP